MTFTAAFLDRDGTIMRDTGYPSRREDVDLLPGAARAIARLNAEAIPVLVVTNQSGIGRGLVTAADFADVQAELERRLVAEGARLDGAYHCPHDPDAGACACRKPHGALFESAAREHRIDARGALYVGDRLRDLAHGVALGARCVLIVPDGVETRGLPESGVPPGEAAATAPRSGAGDIMVARDLEEAVERALAIPGPKEEGQAT